MISLNRCPMALVRILAALSSTLCVFRFGLLIISESSYML
jgi:hypothetical protein